MKILGLTLTIVGVLTMLITGFNYVTEKKVVDLGPIQIDQTINHPMHWSPIVGGIILIIGIAILAVASKKK